MGLQCHQSDHCLVAWRLATVPAQVGREQRTKPKSCLSSFLLTLLFSMQRLVAKLESSTAVKQLRHASEEARVGGASDL